MVIFQPFKVMLIFYRLFNLARPESVIRVLSRSRFSRCLSWATVLSPSFVMFVIDRFNVLRFLKCFKIANPSSVTCRQNPRFKNSRFSSCLSCLMPQAPAMEATKSIEMKTRITAFTLRAFKLECLDCWTLSFGKSHFLRDRRRLVVTLPLQQNAGRQSENEVDG